MKQKAYVIMATQQEQSLPNALQRKKAVPQFNGTAPGN